MTSRWNVGNRYGEMGEFYFLLLQNGPHEKHWHYDIDGTKTYTMFKKTNLCMEGFRKWGLHGPTEAASSSGEETLEPPFLGDAVMSLIGYQIADEKIRLACSTR